MQIKEPLETVRDKSLGFATEGEILEMVGKNELTAYYKKLRAQHPIDYQSLAITAKNLRTLNEDYRRTAISFFKKLDEDSSDDYSSSNENRNLVDQMRQKISLIDCQQGQQDRSALKKRWWTPEQDDKLKQLVEEFGARNWKRIAGFFQDRTDVQCLHRWQKVLNPKLIKGPWTKQQDELVMRLVQQHGPKNWSFIAKNLPGRIGKQCRERWHNHLNPDIKKQRWTEEQDEAIIQAHKKVGNKWALIAKWLPGRTDNAIKNHWNSTIKRKLRMKSNSDDYSDENIVQRLNFNTPEKNKISDWKMTTAEDYTKRLFESNKKIGEITKNILLVFPFFEDDGYLKSTDILNNIQNILAD